MKRDRFNIPGFDLLYEFKKYNGLLFNGELNPVKLGWEYNSHFFGRTKRIKSKIVPKLYHKTYFGKKINFKIKPKIYFGEEITISCYYCYDYDTFKNILIHEMVHVFIIQKGYNDNESHGDIFMKKSTEIDKGGYNCGIESMGSYSLDIYDKSKLTEDVYVIMYRNGNEIIGSIFDESFTGSNDNE